MTRTRTANAARAITCLLAAVLFAQASATSSEPVPASQVQGFAYDLAKEITIVGTVEKLVSHPAPGTPPGLHLLISASGDTIDAHLGPYLSSETQEAIKAASMVQVVGVKENLNGNDVLLARQLIFSGRQITIRNEHGFLIRSRSRRRGTPNNKPFVTGGAQ